jgi:hypothetical protein
MTENQQEHVYQEFIRFREAFIAAHQLLQSDMVSEARAVIAARLDKSLLGESDPTGGHIGEFLISRYKPNAWEGTPENIQIMPRLNARVSRVLAGGRNEGHAGMAHEEEIDS